MNLALGPDADIRAALESLGEEALAMKDMLDARDFPESGSCTHVRASSRMQDDASFAASVERVCFYWRTVTFRYVETHADAVNSGDPEAIDEAKRTFQLIELASMRALLEAGGTIIADNTSYDHNTPTQDYR